MNCKKKPPDSGAFLVFSSMPSLSNIRKFENLHVLFWLIKDLSWAMLWQPLGLFMILPTVSIAVYLLWKNWMDTTERSHNAAVLLWILANSFWMSVEFLGREELKSWSVIPFGFGLLILAIHYGKTWTKKSSNSE